MEDETKDLEGMGDEVSSETVDTEEESEEAGEIE